MLEFNSLQPYENVIGNDRPQDDLLEMNDRALLRRSLMLNLASAFLDSVVPGSSAMGNQELYSRMSTPRIGDLVMENTTAQNREADLKTRAMAFGILLDHRREWAHTDAQWVQYCTENPDTEPEDRPSCAAWYIQYGPNAKDVCRWHNCAFWTVLT